MKPLLVTANGTGVPDPFGPGFSTDVGWFFAYDPWKALANNIGGLSYATLIDWQPCGYRAAVLPMGPSVQELRQEVNRQILFRPKGTPLILSGYSQSAIGMCEVWTKDFLAPTGALHDRLSDVKGIINFGDPVRCPGIANGNKVAGLPAPKKLDGFTTGGIAGPDCLTPDQTPDFLLSCALDGDLYACCPTGDSPWGPGGEKESQVGQIETRIYEFIMSGSILKGFLSVAEGIAEEFSAPLTTTIALVHAIVNGLKFAAAGPSAPHWQYGPFVPPMINWILGAI